MRHHIDISWCRLILHCAHWNLNIKIDFSNVYYPKFTLPLLLNEISICKQISRKRLKNEQFKLAFATWKIQYRDFKSGDNGTVLNSISRTLWRKLGTYIVYLFVYVYRDRCINSACDYLFSIDSVARLEANTLRHLLSSGFDVIAPMLVRPGHAWSNFWGAINTAGFYARSLDYMDIVYQNVK